MNLFLSGSRFSITTTAVLISSLCFHPLKHSSLTVTTKPTKWNSPTNTIITNPILLAMEACTSMLHLKQIQAHMTKSALITHTFPVSRVLAFCALADNGDINHANLLFSQIQNPNTYIWNTMMRGFSRANMGQIGFLFFLQMVQRRVEMDARSFVFALKACEHFIGVLEGQSVHCVIWKTGFVRALLIQNGLVHFYCRAGCLGLARQVFDEISDRDVVSWTSMIGGYCKHNCYDEALKLFDFMLMRDIVKPNEVTMIAILSACAQKGDLRLGKTYHEYVKRGHMAVSLNLSNAILDMYVKCGCLDSARGIFDTMGVRDVFSWTTIVNGYAKSGRLELARMVFDKMPARNVVSWNAMISGYSQNSQPKEALELFHNMLEAGFVPVENTVVCVLSACSQLGHLHFGQWIRRKYISSKHNDVRVIIANALIDMYAKCGAIHEAEKVFTDMPERDLVSWNSMIVAYASHGQAKRALIIFEQMIYGGFKPDDITLVGVLSACSHGGLVNEGREYFQNMKRNYGMESKVEHYACMIDLLGRVGLLEDAYELITTMPMEPSTAAWGALLDACRTHGNVELAIVVAHRLLDLDPEDSGTYVLLANICANGRRWDDVRKARSMLRDRRVKKIPGRSMVQIEGQLHEFLAGDESHPQSEAIYQALDHVILQSKCDDPHPLPHLPYRTLC